MIKIYKTVILPVIYHMNLASSPKGRTQTEDIWEKGSERIFGPKRERK
jgi:hypothetical protein